MFKSVLDFVMLLKKASKNSDRLLHIMGDGETGIVIPVEPKRGDKPFCVKRYSDELKAVLQQAFDEGYIFIYPDETFRLSYKGIHPYKETAQQTVLFILKSVIVPIIVSAITAAVLIRLQLR